jgi:VWFA-related protein
VRHKDSEAIHLKPFIRHMSAAVLAALTLVAPLAAQSRNKQEPDLPRLVENIDVRVINLDVVVTDRKGNPIPNLTKDDFELFENGVPKSISNFFEVAGGKAKNEINIAEAPAAPAPEAAAPLPAAKPTDVPERSQRRIIFFIDNLSLAPFNRNRVFDQMKKFINDVMRPGDEAMIATFNRSMKIRVPFTKDHVHLQQTLDAIAGESAGGASNRSEWKETEQRIRDARSYEEAATTARMYASSIEHDLRVSVSSLNALMSTLAGVEGKKVLVLTSEGYPIQPGREAFVFVDEIGKDKSWSSQGSSMLESMTFDAASLIQSIPKAANANGITMYTIHAGGLTGANENGAENQQATPYSVSFAAMTNTTESMQIMAEMTGGLSSSGTNNFADIFNKIQRDLGSYYSLGYRAGTERVDRQRYLQVKVKNKNYVVRNRQTFVEKSMYAEMGDKVIANLLYRVKDNDLGILARLGNPRPAEDGYFQVPLQIQIPMESLTIMAQGDAGFAGGFDVYVVVADKNNEMSEVARKQHQIHLTAEDMKRVAGRYYAYDLDLLVGKGLNRISVGVVDQISNTAGFALEQIIARDLR